MLERVRGIAGDGEREVPGRVTMGRPVLALNGGLERLASGAGDRDVEREVKIAVVVLIETSGNSDRLGNRERSGLLERDATVVAKGNVDCPAIPVGG